MSEASFGAYLIHPLLIYLLSEAIDASAGAFPWLALIWAIVIGSVSLILSGLLGRIPGLRRLV
ncbi:hypothetical protein H9X80_04505 [Olsenella profusa]|uniref:Acyltransferase n=1 Tax=Olsenella profusa TaxID=138595 RepID=A0ABS2F1E7_9ACTN|nr:hypothetical protein [Olsenella profusa]